MSGWVAFFAAVPPTLFALASVIAAVRAQRTTAETHDLVNSRMSELLELTRSSARAEGVKAATDKREG